MGKLSKWARFTPLSGVLAVVLGVAATAVLAHDDTQTPLPTGPTGQQVIAFYEQHSTTERLAALLLSLAFLFFLFFAGVLRSYLAKVPAEGLASLSLAGAAVETAGQVATPSFIWAILGAPPSSLAPASAQALYVLANNGLNLVNAVGIMVFSIAAGLAILRDGTLPGWLGWMAILIGLLVLTPLDPIQFVVLLVWLPIVSIFMVKRSKPAPAA